MYVCVHMCASVTTASALDFLIFRILVLVSNPPIQMITQHKHTLILQKGFISLPFLLLSFLQAQRNSAYLGGWLQKERSIVPLSERGKGPAGAGRLEAAQAQRAFSKLGQEVSGGAVVLRALTAG